jgi:2-methylisocitrate lyase-like PEP mutase family enzyme
MIDPRTATVAAKAEALRVLHGPGRMLVLPNAWDAASARAIAAAGFPAVATSSAAIAVALGYADHEKAPASEMLKAAARIVSAIDVPVTVDFEAGYRLSPRGIVERLVEIGAAGLNLEDTDHHGAGGLVEAEPHAERLRALKDAARSAGVSLVLNARVDTFVRRIGTPEEQVAEGLRRAKLYRDAGADSIYPIGLADEDSIRAFVEAVGIINVNTRRGGPLTLERLSELGVRRVSYGSSLFRDSLSAVEGFLVEMKASVDSIALHQ